MSRLLLTLFFLLACALTLIAPLFNLALPLHFLAPYLVIALYQRPKKILYFHTFLCGFLLDLLNAQTPFGFWTLIYILSMQILTRLKPLFSIEKILSLSLLTFVFSISSTLFYALLSPFFCAKMHFSLKWVIIDGLFLPFCDAISALLLFALPYKLFSRVFATYKRGPTSLNLKENSL